MRVKKENAIDFDKIREMSPFEAEVLLGNEMDDTVDSHFAQFDLLIANKFEEKAA